MATWTLAVLLSSCGAHELTLHLALPDGGAMEDLENLGEQDACARETVNRRLGV